MWQKDAEETVEIETFEEIPASAAKRRLAAALAVGTAGAVVVAAAVAAKSMFVAWPMKIVAATLNSDEAPRRRRRFAEGRRPAAAEL